MIGSTPATTTTAPSNNFSREQSRVSSPAVPQMHTLVNRARELISSNINTLSTSAQRSLQQYPKRRRLGHRYGKEREQKPPETKTFELVCLHKPSSHALSGNLLQDYQMTKEDICMSGAVDLSTNDKESEIRLKIWQVLVTRVPEIMSDDFEFVKVLRKMVITPVVKEGQDFDYKMIKTLIGQGKMYIRLNKSFSQQTDPLWGADHETITNQVEDREAMSSRMMVSDRVTVELIEEDPVVPPEDDFLAELRNIFPQHEESQLASACIGVPNVHAAIENVLTSQTDGKQHNNICLGTGA